MVLEQAGLSPGQLELEVKEPALLENYAASAANLADLEELGITVALDDFGNGGSSAISHLRRLPVDVIKLDRSLIRETGHPGIERVIAQGLTELAHSLAIRVVAGGVETKAQLSFVREAGCDSLQGYLISPPLDGDGMTAWLGKASKAASQGAKSSAASRRRSSRKRSAPK